MLSSLELGRNWPSRAARQGVPLTGYPRAPPHVYELKDELDSAWATRPLALEHERGRLLLEDSGGEPLVRLLGAPAAVESFLCLAIGTASALREVHNHGPVHKDIKPANILVHRAIGEVRLTGFGTGSIDPPRFTPPGGIAVASVQTPGGGVSHRLQSKGPGQSERRSHSNPPQAGHGPSGT
jgi:serine/threonine protein kinase